MVQNKVLILSANYGEGHAQVSNAIVNELKSQGFEGVKIVDLLKQSHPLIDTVSRKFYLKSYTNLPGVYGWLYHSTKYFPLESKRAKLLHSFGVLKMKQLLKEERPNLLIHTFPGSAASELKRKHQIDLPIFSVITDFTFHQRWVHQEIDRYFVATEDLKQELIAFGVKPEKIMVSGIPIRSNFEEKASKDFLYKKYGLDSGKKIILILAGALGVSSDVKKTCDHLKFEKNIQVVMVCGKNQDLEQEMTERYSEFGHLKVIGYTETIHELMRLADCLVTKPGGVTIFEALATGLPLFFFPPVPGQEEENARFLEAKGAALTLNKHQDIGKQILAQLNNEQSMRDMAITCGKLYQPNAAHYIAEQVAAYLLNETLDVRKQINS